MAAGISSVYEVDAAPFAAMDLSVVNDTVCESVPGRISVVTLVIVTVGRAVIPSVILSP